MCGSETIVVERAIGYLAQNYVSGWIEWVGAGGGGAGRRTPLVVKRSRALKVYNTDRAKSFNTMTLKN